MGSNFSFKFTLAAVMVVSVAIMAGCGNPSKMNESSPNVKHITQSEFGDEVTRCATPVAVEFYAVWCGPCQEESPILDRVAQNYTGKIKFVKLNVDESPGIAQNYEAQEIPLLILFKDGKLVDRLTGLQTQTNLTARLNALAGVK